MPTGVLMIYLLAWGALSAAALISLPDERPRRGGSALDRALRWSFERLFLALLFGALVAALFVFGLYLAVGWLA